MAIAPRRGMPRVPVGPKTIPKQPARPRAVTPLPKPRTIVPPSGPEFTTTAGPAYTPGQLDARGIESIGNRDLANKTRVSRINMDFDAAQGNYDRGMAAEKYNLEQSLMRGAQQAAGSGLLRSGLFQLGQARSREASRLTTQGLEDALREAQASRKAALDAESASYDLDTSAFRREAEERALAAWMDANPAPVTVGIKPKAPIAKTPRPHQGVTRPRAAGAPGVKAPGKPVKPGIKRTH